MSALTQFANLTARPAKGKCARCTRDYALDNGARAAVNADLYNRPAGADKQARIAHHSETVCESCAVEMWQVITTLYDFAAYRAQQQQPQQQPDMTPPAVQVS